MKKLMLLWGFFFSFCGFAYTQDFASLILADKDEVKTYVDSIKGSKLISDEFSRQIDYAISIEGELVYKPSFSFSRNDNCIFIMVYVFKEEYMKAWQESFDSQYNKIDSEEADILVRGPNFVQDSNTKVYTWKTEASAEMPMFIMETIYNDSHKDMFSEEMKGLKGIFVFTIEH